MFARITTVSNISEAMVPQVLEAFREQIIPALEQEEGFRGVMVMADRETGVAITFWEGRRDVRTSRETEYEHRMQAAADVRRHEGPPPEVKSFEVMLVAGLGSAQELHLALPG